MRRTGFLLLVTLVVAQGTSRAGDPPGADPALPQPGAEARTASPAAATAKGRRAKDAAAKDAAGPARDRLELDATAVTGSRELPKVLVIVPWKRADLGDLVGKPLNSLVDEALQPLDREVFRREVDYHATLAPDRATAPPAAAGR